MRWTSDEEQPGSFPHLPACRCLVLLPSFTCQHPIPAPHSSTLSALLSLSSLPPPSLGSMEVLGSTSSSLYTRVHIRTHRLSPLPSLFCATRLCSRIPAPKLESPAPSITARASLWLEATCSYIKCARPEQPDQHQQPSRLVCQGRIPSLFFLSVFPDLINAVTIIDVTEG